MHILYTTQCWSTTREVITTALYCKHWIYLPGSLCLYSHKTEDAWDHQPTLLLAYTPHQAYQQSIFNIIRLNQVNNQPWLRGITYKFTSYDRERAFFALSLSPTRGVMLEWINSLYFTKLIIINSLCFTKLIINMYVDQSSSISRPNTVTSFLTLCIWVKPKLKTHNLKNEVPSCSKRICGRLCSWTINTPSTVLRIPFSPKSSRNLWNLAWTLWSLSTSASLVPNV